MTKRFHNIDVDVAKLAMADCVKLSQRPGLTELDRIFKCKTCQKTFGSFQALGGHTASHKRPKIVTGDEEIKNLRKPHRCGVCAGEFWTGQALGGHMRKHRTVTPAAKIDRCTATTSHQDEIIDHHGGQSSTITSCDYESAEDVKAVMMIDRPQPRILGMDLNLTPEENEFKF